MPLILQQRFPLGRFHATRWRQNPFEDRHGEWPPSPWRFLRALAARWIQFSRETGDEDTSARDDLLSRLAGSTPEFVIPATTWRAEPSVRQYHKTAVEWTAKGKKDPAYKKSTTTLVPDVCRAIAPDDSVLWLWPQLDLSDVSRKLLDELLRRMLYFGRAESFCLFRRLEHWPSEASVNCRLTTNATDQAPVLVPKPGEPLNIAALLAASDDALVRNHPIPPGAAWYYSKLPPRPTTQREADARSRFPNNLHVIQFAVGGRVYPRVRDWIRVTERFRGAALKELARLVTGERNAKFGLLPSELREEYSLFSGKFGDGSPVSGHNHVYFALYPDESGLPTRLVCFRREEFTSEEIAALLAASERPCSWRYERQRSHGEQRDEWQLRFVPLPFETPPPVGLRFDVPTSTTWVSATPFVVPGGRKRFRKNGRLRLSETPERLIEKLLVGAGYPTPEMTRLNNDIEEEWVAIHESPAQRKRRCEARTRAVLPAHRFHLSFPNPVAGPICVGHSCHFGLGLFRPV